MDSSPPSNPNPQAEKVEITPELAERISLNLQIKSRDMVWYLEFINHLGTITGERLSEGLPLKHIFEGLKKIAAESPDLSARVLILLNNIPHISQQLILPTGKCCDLKGITERDRMFVSMAALAYGWYIRHMLGRKEGRHMEKIITRYIKASQKVFDSLDREAMLELITGHPCFEELVSEEPDRESADSEKRKMALFKDGAEKNINSLPLSSGLRNEFIQSISNDIFGNIFVSYLIVTANTLGAKIFINKGNLELWAENLEPGDVEEIRNILSINQETISRELLKIPDINLEKLKKRVAQNFFKRGHRVIKNLNKKEPEAQKISKALQAAMLLTAEFLNEIDSSQLVHYTSHELHAHIMEALPDPEEASDPAHLRSKTADKVEAATQPPEEPLEITPEMIKRANVNLQILARDPEWYGDFAQTVHEGMQQTRANVISSDTLAEEANKHIRTKGDFEKLEQMEQTIFSNMKAFSPKCCDFGRLIENDKARMNIALISHRWYMHALLGKFAMRKVGKAFGTFKRQAMQSIEIATGEFILRHLAGTKYYAELTAENPATESADEEKRKHAFLIETAQKNFHQLPIPEPLKEAIVQNILDSTAEIVHQAFFRIAAMFYGMQMSSRDGMLYIKIEDKSSVQVKSEEMKQWVSENTAATVRACMNIPYLTLRTIKTICAEHFLKRISGIEKMIVGHGTEIQKLRATYKTAGILTGEYLEAADEKVLIQFLYPAAYQELIDALPPAGGSQNPVSSPAREADTTYAETMPEKESLSEKEQLYITEVLGDFFHIKPYSRFYAPQSLLQYVKEEKLIAECVQDVNHLYRKGGPPATEEMVENFLQAHFESGEMNVPSIEVKSQFRIPTALARRIDKAVEDWQNIYEKRTQSREEKFKESAGEEDKTYIPRQQFSDRVGICIVELLNDSMHLKVSTLTQLEALVGTLELITGQLVEWDNDGQYALKKGRIDIGQVVLALSDNGGESEPDANILKLRDLLERQNRAVTDIEEERQRKENLSHGKDRVAARISDYHEEQTALAGRLLELEVLRAETRNKLAEYFSRVSRDLNARSEDERDNLLSQEEEEAVAVGKTVREIEHLARLIKDAEKELGGLIMAIEGETATQPLEKQIMEKQTQIHNLQSALLGLYLDYAEKYF